MPLRTLTIRNDKLPRLYWEMLHLGGPANCVFRGPLLFTLLTNRDVTRPVLNFGIGEKLLLLSTFNNSMLFPAPVNVSISLYMSALTACV